MPQPSEEEHALLQAWAEGLLEKLASASPNDPGQVVMPRLSSTEYDNVIRDLTGVSMNVGQFLPVDGGAGEGFSNVGAAQTLTVTQFESFLSVAHRVVSRGRWIPGQPVHWSAQGYPEAATNEDLRLQALTEFVDWFKKYYTDQNRAHFSQIERELKLEPYAAYMEAAWQFEHRSALGMGGKTLAEVAAAYDVPLFPGVLERVHAALTGKGGAELNANPWFLKHRQTFAALPRPRGSDPASQRASFAALFETYEDDWASVENWMKGWSAPLEISYHAPASGGTEWRQHFAKIRDNGVNDFVLDLTKAQGNRLYLVVTTTYDGPEGDVIRFSKGRMTLAGGREVAWQEAIDGFVSKSGSRVGWGSHPGGATLAPGEISLEGGNWLAFDIPQGAQRLTFTATEDVDAGANPSVQVFVLDSEPESLVWQPRREIFGHGKFARARRANQLRTNAFVTQTTHNGWIRLRDGQVYGLLPEDVAQAVGKAGVREAPRGPERPFNRDGPEVFELASEAQQAELAEVVQRMRGLIFPAQMQLAAFLRENGFANAVEGQLLNDAQRRGLASAQRTTYDSLARAVEAEMQAQMDEARKYVRGFASRAWRRVVTEAEIASLMDLFALERAAGFPPNAAMQSTLKAVLVSPNFLFRPVRSYRDGEVHALTDFELATRLSFFLWASIPDEELLRLAHQGKLKDPAVLRGQLQRMVADPRGEALATQFGAQWLHFAGFEQKVQPDPERFPEFDEALKRAMRDEVIFFLRDLFENDRPVLRLIDANYTFLNEPLARHYGINGVRGEQMRRVEVDPQRRGGLLGMAGFLTLYSEPLRTSPVKRGVWVHEQLLGVELPPPPPVPLLSDDETNAEGLTLVEQLAIHRADPACFSCHDRIDPLGLPLENFDPLGRWRVVDGAGNPVITVGERASGLRIDGLEGLRGHLLERQDQVLENFCRKLIGYALGRSVELTDGPLIESMMSALKASDYRPSVALEQVVLSAQFLNRRDESDESVAQRN